MSVYPDPSPADVAGRIGVPADSRVQACINAAAAAWEDDVDPVLVNRYPDTWTEGVTQLAIKVYETGTRGVSQYDQGGWDMPAPAATSGLRRSVSGIMQPLLKTPPGWA